ncbi:MAG: glycosyltransferase family 4 protein, partial [Segetibacter sp.]
MVKILCVSKIPPSAPSGVVTYYKKLYEYFLNDTDVSIDLITTADTPLIQKKFAGLVRRFIYLFSFKNKKIVKFSTDINLKLIILFALRKYKNVNYDIIHAQDIHCGYITKLFFKSKIPLILTCHFNDTPVEEDLLLYRFKMKHREYLDKIYKQKFKEVDEFIFVSKYVYDKSKYLLGEVPNVEVIYNGAHFSNFRRKRKNNGTLQIVNVGFVEERKNQKIFLSIAKALIQNNLLDFHITIVGDGHDLPLIKSMVDKDGLTRYFSFPGWTDEVHEYLKKSDLYIHTALNDNCPYSVIEAISNKLPVIAFNVGGIPEIVCQDFLFKLNDYKSMTDFIIRNLPCLPEIGEQQYNRIAKTFSENYQFERTK